MADLIDRTDAIKLLRGEAVGKYPQSFLFGLFAAADELKKLPVVDAVEVVRCKDCTWGKWWQNKAGVEGFGCELLCADITTEGFCSYGERRTDA